MTFITKEQLGIVACAVCYNNANCTEAHCSNTCLSFLLKQPFSSKEIAYVAHWLFDEDLSYFETNID